jgi:hypothetical protein
MNSPFLRRVLTVDAVVSGVPGLLGYGFVIAQAVMVGLFAELEVVGLMRQRRAA